MLVQMPWQPHHLPSKVKVRDHGADSCEACAHVFIKSGDCSRLFKAPVVDEMLPEPCRTVGPRCLERISAGCHSSAEAPCRTAREGDACFGNVRWAMERGAASGCGGRGPEGPQRAARPERSHTG